MTRILSWNVNGIRAVAKKGFLDWFTAEAPDLLCIQETKAQPEQLDESILNVEGYHAYWASAEKKGYSGVGAYSRQEPQDVRTIGIEEFDAEGRVLELEFRAFTVIAAYFPNSQDGGKRIEYKIRFCDAMQARCNEIVEQGRHLVLCGDYNVAHKPVDLARPKENEKSPGYLPEERAWMDRFVADGYVDTFRMFNAEGGNYTWWSYFTKGRERNVGWRIDYHCVDANTKEKVKSAEILSSVMGSDHCPVGLTLDL